MSFNDDLKRIYEKEKNDYGIRMMEKQETPHPEYEFESFEEWMEYHGYN